MIVLEGLCAIILVNMTCRQQHEQRPVYSRNVWMICTIWFYAINRTAAATRLNRGP